MKTDKENKTEQKKEEVDIYRRHKWPAEYKRRLTAANISSENKKLIDEYFIYLTKKQVRPTTQRSYLSAVISYAEALGPQGISFMKLTEKDNARICTSITQGLKDPKGKLGPISWFMCWTLRQQYMDKVKGEQAHGRLFDKDNVPELYVEKDINRDHSTIRTWAENVEMAEAAPNSLMKTLIYFLADSGVRIGEALNMRIADIIMETNNKGVSFRVSGKGLDGHKTKFSPRICPLERTGHLMLDYVENRAVNRKQNNSPLWAKPNGETFTETAILVMLKKVAAKVGSQKPSNPHSFRWSSMSDKAARWPQQVVLKYHGESPNSRSLDHYVSLTPEQLQTVAWKIPVAENKIVEVSEGVCSWCQTKNPIGHQSCVLCGRSLVPDVEAYVEERKKVVNDAVHQEAEKLGLTDAEAFNLILTDALAKRKKQQLAIKTPTSDIF